MDMAALTKIINIAKNKGLSEDEINELAQQANNDPLKLFKLINEKAKEKSSSIELQTVKCLVIGLSGVRLGNKYDVSKAKKTSDGKMYKIDETGSFVKDNEGNLIEVIPRYEKIGYVLINDVIHQIRVRCFENDEGKLESRIKIDVPGVYELGIPKTDDGKIPKIMNVFKAKKLDEIPNVTKVFSLMIDDITKVPINEYCILPLKFIHNKTTKTKDGREFTRALFVMEQGADTIFVNGNDEYEDISKNSQLVAGKIKIKETANMTFYTIIDPVEIKLQ